MASLNYMQTTTFKFFYASLYFIIISVLLHLLHVCCMLYACFTKGLYYEQKLKWACNIKGNISRPISIYCRTIFSGVTSLFILRIWWNSFETWNKWWFTTHKIRRGQYFRMSCVVWPFFSMINASCKVWFLDMVSKVFQDIWANSKTESGLYNNMSIIGWNCDRKCNRNRLIVYQVYQPKKMHSLSPLRSELNRQWLYVIWYDGHPLGHVGSLRVLTMHNSWPCGLKINES